MPTKSDDLLVFISRRESTCGECGEELGRRAWITLAGERSALCLACADLEHLVFLPSGDTALTRRARKHSVLSAVVLQWSRTRGRYERQGLLVEEEALAAAEQECLADADARERQRARAAERREEVDREFVRRFAARIREEYPACPERAEDRIAEHACRKYSGRVGRSASARALERRAVELAVTAYVRHVETGYDRMLARGVDRHDARDRVASDVALVLASWRDDWPAAGDSEVEANDGEQRIR